MHPWCAALAGRRDDAPESVPVIVEDVPCRRRGGAGPDARDPPAGHLQMDISETARAALDDRNVVLEVVPCGLGVAEPVNDNETPLDRVYCSACVVAALPVV